MSKKWTILTGCMVIIFTQFYVMELPEAIGKHFSNEDYHCQMEGKCLNLTEKDVHTFTSGAMWAGAAATTIAVALTARARDTHPMLRATIFMLIGTALFAGGAHISTNHLLAYCILLISRVIFGFGSGAATAVANHLVNQWWENSALVTTLFVAVGSIGSSLGILNVLLVEKIGLYWCLWIPVIFMTVAVAAGHFVARTGEREDKRSKPVRIEQFVQNVGLLFWSFAGLFFFLRATISIYTYQGTSILKEYYHFDDTSSILAIGLVHIGSVAVMPIIGFIVYKLGHRDYAMVAGSIAVLLAASVLCIAPSTSPWIVAGLTAVSFAVTEPIGISSSSILSPEGTEGLANAVLEVLRYISTGVVSTGMGELTHKEDWPIEQRHHVWSILFVELAAMGVVMSLVVVWLNRKSADKPLSLSFKERQELEEQKQREDEHQNLTVDAQS